MADKMMRIAGRGKNGLAKGLQTDNDGILKTQNQYSRVLAEKQLVALGSTYSTGYIDSNGYNFAKTKIYYNGQRKVKVYLTEWFPDGDKKVLIFNGNSDQFIEVEYKINSLKYKIEIEAVDALYIVLAEESLYSKDRNNNQYNLVRESTIIPANTPFKTQVFDNFGSGNFSATLYISGSRNYKVYLLENERRKLIFNGDSTDVNTINYDVSEDKHQLEIVPTADIYLNAKSFVMAQPKSQITPKYPVRQIMAPFSLTGVVTKRSNLLNSMGYQTGRITGEIHQSRYIEVSIVDVYGTTENKRLVFKGNVTSVINLTYEIKTTEYYIEITTGTSGLWLKSNVQEQLIDIPKTDETKTEVKIRRKPDSFLKFSKVNTDVKVFSHFENKYIILDSADTFKIYTSLLDDSEPIETGIKLDTTTYGTVEYIIPTENGIVILTNVASGDLNIPKVFKMTDIHSQPVLKYEPSFGASTAIWSRHFGVDYYSNGLETMIVAGMYGVGSSDKELIISKDSGDTFTLSKTLKHTLSVEDNNHWHDVKIDVAHNLIWASAGDTDTNRRIFYSIDFGKTWTQLDLKQQPSSIIPFADKVVFGRDNNEVGLDELPIPINIRNISSYDYRPSYIFNNLDAGKYYPLHALMQGDEAYLSYFLLDTTYNLISVATGDGGETWHRIFYSAGHRLFYKFVHLDDEYIYAYLNAGSTGQLVVSKKPKWLEY